MPKLNHEIIILRDYTVSAVGKAIQKGRAINEKQALKQIYDKSQRIMIATGFDNTKCFNKFYQAYKSFKNKYWKEK